jgi:hypothetical protein
MNRIITTDGIIIVTIVYILNQSYVVDALFDLAHFAVESQRVRQPFIRGIERERCEHRGMMTLSAVAVIAQQPVELPRAQRMIEAHQRGSFVVLKT